MRHIHAFGVMLCFASLALAQQQELPRRTHPGRVLDDTGKPIAGAEVTFASGNDGFGFQQDVITTTTGSNGRFRIDLLPTRRYRAWAIAPAGTIQDDAAVASTVVDRGVPMTEIQFPAQSGTQPVAPGFTIRQLDVWRQHGEVRVDVWVAGCRVVAEAVAVAADGRVPLPPLPHEPRVVHVFVAGRFVHARTTSGDLTMPAPHVVRGRCLDPNGKPIAGARIERIWQADSRQAAPFRERTRVRRFDVATTDADGMAQWLVAAARDPFAKADHRWPPLAFVAGADGFAESVAGFTGTTVSDDRMVADEIKNRTLPFVLQVQAASRVEVVPMQPAMRLAWCGAHTMPSDANSSTTAVDARLGEAMVDGVVWLRPWSARTEEPRLYLTDVLPPVAADDPFRAAATPWPLELIGRNDRESFRINLADVVALRVQLLDARGGPAASADVACVSLENGVDEPLVWPIAPDPVGRFVLPVLPGRYLIVALQGGDWVMRDLEVARAQEPVTLSLEPLPRARFRVVDGKGTAVAGASISSSGASWGGMTNPVQSVLQEFGHVYSDWAMDRAISDEQGHLEVPLIPAEGLSIDYCIKAGMRQSSEGKLLAGEDRVDVVVR